jgi:hypothetical protein
MVHNLLSCPKTMQQERIIDIAQGLTMNDVTDVLTWRLTTLGIYTTKSFYSAIVGGGKIRCWYKNFWKVPTPSTTRIFFYLLM